MRSGKIVNFILWVLLGLFAALQVIGCGGGTTGTGGSSSDEFVGRILNVDGNPVSGATITVAETGDSAQSAADGTFSIETDLVADKATLLVDLGPVETRVVVDEIPSEASVIEVVLEVEPEGDSVKLADKKVRPKKPRPTPKRTPEPGDDDGSEGGHGRPTASPSPMPGESPQPTETPRISRADFRGDVSAADPSLLNGLHVALQGQAGSSPVRPNGIFRFEARPDVGLKIYVFRGSETASAPVDGLTISAKRVFLSLRVFRNGSGALSVEVLSVRIRNDGDRSVEGAVSD